MAKDYMMEGWMAGGEREPKDRRRGEEGDETAMEEINQQSTINDRYT